MNNQRLKILLLGGTGAMGVHLSKILNNQGEDVYVTTRRERKGMGITYIQGNAHENAFLSDILQKYHFDVLIDFMIYNTSEFADRVDLLLSSVGQYIFLSSSRVYADSQTPITENSPRLLDVYKEEPLQGSELYELEQVLLTQHNAGISEESKVNMSLYAAMGVDQVLTGQVPSWPVNHPVNEK